VFCAISFVNCYLKILSSLRFFWKSEPVYFLWYSCSRKTGHSRPADGNRQNSVTLHFVTVLKQTFQKPMTFLVLLQEHSVLKMIWRPVFHQLWRVPF